MAFGLCVQPADIGWPTGNGKKKLQPSTAGPGNMLGCGLVSFHILWAIPCPQARRHGKTFGRVSKPLSTHRAADYPSWSNIDQREARSGEVGILPISSQ